MTGESLIFLSAVLVGISLLLAGSIALYDKHRADELREFSASRHGRNSIFSLSGRSYAVPFLLYLAVAFAADIALEWLAAIALFCFFAAIAVNRICTPLLRKAIVDDDGKQAVPQRSDTDSNATSHENAMLEAPKDGVSVPNERKRLWRLRLPSARTPEPLAKIISETASLLATIVGWTAIVDLIVLLFMVLVETVIPHYISLLGAVL